MTLSARPDAGSRRRTIAGAVLLSLAAALAIGAATSLASARVTASQAPDTAAAPARTVARASAAQVGSGLVVLRARAVQVPLDPGAWSGLGFAVLERARASGDPALYAEAGASFARSLRVQGVGNVLAVAGQAAVADARHEFAEGERLARRALVIDAVSPVALAAWVDALTELGRYPQALVAADRLDAVRPGVASFTRLSYQRELRGQTGAALGLLRRAAAVADTPAEIAFARAQEGLLAIASGDLGAARVALRQGLIAAPDDTSLLHLSARVAVAGGDPGAAVTAYATLIARRPAPAWAGEQADLLAGLGDTRGAAIALDVARASYRLAATAGIAPDATQVLFEADHGDPARAVALGAALARRAPSTGDLDAYAWALHRAGRDRQALPLIDRALALGGRPPLFVHHHTAITAAIQHDSAIAATAAGTPR